MDYTKALSERQQEVVAALNVVARFIASASIANTNGNRDEALLHAGLMGADFGRSMVEVAQKLIEWTRDKPEVDEIVSRTREGAR